MTNASPTPSWAELKDLLRWFATMFGEPKGLADRASAPRSEGLVMRGWLNALEAIVRALLLTMAAGLREAAPARARATALATAKRLGAPALRPPTDDIRNAATESDRWVGVRFRALPRAPREALAPDGRRDERCEPRERLPTRALACRFEALIRVAENPHPRALRLARRLRADARRARKLAFRLLKAPPERDASRSMREGVAQAQSLAWRAFDARDVAPAPAPDTG